MLQIFKLFYTTNLRAELGASTSTIVALLL